MSPRLAAYVVEKIAAAIAQEGIRRVGLILLVPA